MNSPARREGTREPPQHRPAPLSSLGFVKTPFCYQRWAGKAWPAWRAGLQAEGFFSPEACPAEPSATGPDRDPATALSEAAAQPVPKAKLLGHPEAGHAAEGWDTQLHAANFAFVLQEVRCNTAALQNIPCQPSRFPGTAQKRAHRKTFTYKYIYIYMAASFVPGLLKGTNYIHSSKVVTKCIRRDSTVLTDSSETRLGDKRAGGRAKAELERGRKSHFHF